MAADVFAFLELEGIEGEAQDSDHQGKIELQSFSWGASNNSSFATGTGGSVGKGQIHDISISMYTSRASLRLMERAVNGQHINKAKLSLLKQSGNKNSLFRIGSGTRGRNLFPDLGPQRRTASDGVGHPSLREGEVEIPAARQRGRRHRKRRFRVGPAKERGRLTDSLRCPRDGWMVAPFTRRGWKIGR